MASRKGDPFKLKADKASYKERTLKHFRSLSRTGSMEKRGIEWTHESGYRAVRYEDQFKSRKGKNGYTKRIDTITGPVYVSEREFDDFIGHERVPKGEENRYVAKYIEDADFSGDTNNVAGVGHIASISYAPKRQLMKVQFAENTETSHGSLGGATVVFFQVWPSVYGELAALAVSKSTFKDKKGVVRHNLGKRFWEIVRIKGQRTGSRYRYMYTDENDLASDVDAFASDKIAAVEEKGLDLEKEDRDYYSMLGRNKLPEDAKPMFQKLVSSNVSAADLEKYLKKHKVM
jgi:hypothetical protein